MPLIKELYKYIVLFSRHIDSMSCDMLGDGYTTFRLHAGNLTIQFLSKHYEFQKNVSCQLRVDDQLLEFNEYDYDTFRLFVLWNWTQASMSPRFQIVIQDGENMFMTDECSQVLYVDEEFHRTLVSFINFLDRHEALAAFENMHL